MPLDSWIIMILFCLFSSDADFIRLFEFLRKKKKKIILIKGGFVQHGLIKVADLIINSQDIKSDIAFIKQKSRQRGEVCEFRSYIHGQGIGYKFLLNN